MQFAAHGLSVGFGPTCWTSTCTLYPGRLALGGPDNPRIVELCVRSNANRLSFDCADLPSNIPTELDP